MQWLDYTSTVGDTGLILGQGTKNPQGLQPGQKKRDTGNKLKLGVKTGENNKAREESVHTAGLVVSRGA